MEHVLSLSYGKDSLACLGAIEELGWPLDRIVHAEVWATDTIPADLPPMVEFKAKADEIIKARWGIEVEHVCAMKDGKKVTYESIFYREINPKRERERECAQCEDSRGTTGHGAWIGSKPTSSTRIYGFPIVRGQWCNSALKMPPLRMANQHQTRELVHEAQDKRFPLAPERGRENIVQYIGIAADEPNRFHNLTDTKRSPLVVAGWDEAYCRKWCEDNDLLSPIYTTATRGGCWFCHNQGIGQLRLLRKNYPEYWQMMLKWDKDSPVTFKPDGRTVHDFDERFQLEDEGFILPDEKFRWSMLEDGGVNYRLF